MSEIIKKATMFGAPAYAIYMEDGFVHMQRQYPALASDRPLSENEKVIIKLCQHILELEQAQINCIEKVLDYE